MSAQKKAANPVVGSKKNYFYHYIDGSLFVFAMSFISLQTVIPVFIKEAGGGAISVGLFPLLWGVGINLPQLFFQPGVQHGFIKKTMLRFALVHRLMFLVIALFCFFIFPLSPFGNNTALLLTLLFFAAFTGSFAVPTWLHFFAKTVPVENRGRLLSIRQFTGSLLGILAGFIITQVLSICPFPQNYGVLFFTTFTVMMGSFFALSRVSEQHEVLEEKALIHPVKAGWEMLKSDREFRNYVYTDMLGQWISTATAFLPVYAVVKFNAGSAAIGGFTSLLMIGMIVINPVLGVLADKKGHKINVILYHLFTGLTCIVAILSKNLFVFGAVFILSAVPQAVLGISRIGIVLEMAPENKRRMYVSAVATFSSPFVISGIVHGGLISLLGYEPVFILDAVLAGVGAFALYKKVAEPRNSATV